jgi:hypothetical protein
VLLGGSRAESQILAGALLRMASKKLALLPMAEKPSAG